MSDGRPRLTRNAERVLEARYLRRDEGGAVVETPRDLLRRVARGVAEAELRLHGPDEAERWERTFLECLLDLELLPNSPTLMNAGTALGQLAACFVLPVPDSLDGIFRSLRDMALIQKSGGGTGFAFSRLRPRGARIASTGGTSSGPVSFMQVFECATGQIAQGGRRRGANMGILRVDHPDIEAFIDAKRRADAFPSFNLSVAATDEFLEAASAGRPYALRDPRDGKGWGERDAGEILRAIADAAWATGDPGAFFLDAANRANPLPALGPLEATNPCGEIPLLPYESCNLASINLARLVDEGDGVARFRRARFAELVRIGIRFLDDVVEVNRFPLPRSARVSRGNRKLGLGVMGFAEALVRLEIPYDSDEAVSFADSVAELLAAEALEASRELAARRGPFPNWERSRFAGEGAPVRNATRTAVAPTGTISIIAGTSPGIEPFFSLAYRRVGVLGGETLRTVNPLVEEWAGRFGVDPRALLARVRRGEPLGEVPAAMRRLFLTALEIPPARHLEIQAAFQRHVDNAVSKTVNLPEEASVEDVEEIYRGAWELGLKGITVFRHGSKGREVLRPGVDDGEADGERTEGGDREIGRGA